MKKNWQILIKNFTDLLISEDAARQDLTSRCLIPQALQARAVLILKEPGVVAGLPLASEILKNFDRNLKFKPKVQEGSTLKKNSTIAEISGPARSILSSERLVLNLLQKLSGIATLTREFVKKTAGTKAKIIDTRKNHPGLRWLEKYAVGIGGGGNHRFNLAEAILIKDNHLTLVPFEKLAKIFKKSHGVKTEIEVKNLNELRKILAKKLHFDWIMLDNMPLKQMKKAVALIRKYKPKIKIEASGRVNLKNVRQIAQTGVDSISVGALTHSARFLDISLEISKL